MQVWRIAKKNRALDRTGVGASLKGGRWNSQNVPAIYAGMTPEIAAFEKLVHTGPFLPDDLVLVRISLPDDASLYESPKTLPKGWDTLPSSPVAAAMGDEFIAKGKKLGLIVPSAVMPEAKNIVINPNHPRIVDVGMEIVRQFVFDPRLRP